jgi:hypothetical protein
MFGGPGGPSYIYVLKKDKVMFKLTQYRRLEMDSLFKGYAYGFITDDELDYMLDITLGEVSCVNIEF